jgi:hypothetical protein
MRHALARPCKPGEVKCERHTLTSASNDDGVMQEQNAWQMLVRSRLARRRCLALCAELPMAKGLIKPTRSVYTTTLALSCPSNLGLAATPPLCIRQRLHPLPARETDPPTGPSVSSGQRLVRMATIASPPKLQGRCILTVFLFLSFTLRLPVALAHGTIMM